ncbi:MAG: glycosyltransferase family 39 protein [Thermoleophilaceae bacterium]|nr:glycosyltransferase family 39 protein [Thermoleophilaceae bacterium]
MLALAAIAALAYAFIAWYAVRSAGWVVMTDELQHSKLALNVFREGGLLPRLHGEPFRAYSHLYPLLTSPFWALFSPPVALRAVHLLNALLMTSTAAPAYLLARRVIRSPWAGLLVAALAVAVPWTMFSTMVLTESAAYPAFAWAVLAMQRALTEPGPRSDALAVAALAVAFLARTQFVVLAAILPAAVLLHESLLALREGGLRAVPARLAAAAGAHRLLAAAVVLGVVAVAVAGTSVLGTYGTTTEAPLLPAGLGRALVGHLDYLVVGVGVLPGMLAAAWCAATLARPLDPPSQAFAVLLALTVPILLIEVTSYDINFAHGGTQIRYAFYLAPLLFTGMAALLATRRGAWPALLLAGAGLAWAIGIGQYVQTTGPFFSSPETAFHSVLDGRSYDLGRLLGIGDLSATTVLWVGTAALAVALALVLPRVRAGAALAVVGGAVLAYCCVETGYVYHRAVPVNPLSAVAGTGADWIDHRIGAAGEAALVPSTAGTANTQSEWWGVEFWNKSVDRAYSFEGGPTYTPFPVERLSLDWRSGTIAAPPDARRYLVLRVDDPRFRPQGRVVASDGAALELLEVARPYRAAWATRGVRSSDGYVGRSGTVRVWPQDGGGRLLLSIALAAPPELSSPAAYRLSAGRVRRRGRLDPGESRTLALALCVPSGGHADVSLRTRGRVVIGAAPGIPGTPLGVRIARVRSAGARGPCSG